MKRGQYLVVSYHDQNASADAITKTKADAIRKAGVMAQRGNAVYIVVKVVEVITPKGEVTDD